MMGDPEYTDEGSWIVAVNIGDACWDELRYPAADMDADEARERGFFEALASLTQRTQHTMYDLSVTVIYEPCDNAAYGDYLMDVEDAAR